MSARYFIENGDTISEPMPLDWDGALVAFMFYDGAGQPVTVTGMPMVWQSLYESGDIWKPVNPFATGEWRFNGPASRVRISLAGVSGYTTYRALVWRTNDPMPLIPDGAYVGLRAAITQPYDEANKKLGAQWEASRLLTIASNAPANNAYSILLTGSKPIDLKARSLGYTGLGVVGRIYEAPTYTGGTSDPWFNLNTQYIGQQPEAQLLVGFTLTATGTKCGADIIAIGPTSQQARGSTATEYASNRILPKPNTAYLLEIASLDPASQQVSARLEVYEGELDLPILT